MQEAPPCETLTARAIDRLGMADFYDRLLDLPGHSVPHDLAALVRCSRAAPPDLIIPRIVPTPAMLAYYHHFYAFDPFHAHWQGGGDTGVFRLRAIVAGIGPSRYAREFLTAMSIHDEIAVFLPAFGAACPTLILDRAKGSFTKAEVVRVRRLYPLLAALHRRHLSILVSTGVEQDQSTLGQKRPLRLVDMHGLQVFATQPWLAIAARQERGLAAALAIVAARDPCVAHLPGQFLLRHTQLAIDFGPAPGGFCDEITADLTQPDRGLAQGLPYA